MHYGRDLQFGTFITPTNDPPELPVRLAQIAEAAGFDLVTFQDHPYQPGFHDTWTLLSWVAASTERVHLAGNVLNLPLQREPVVLARAAASLDLLSGGRFELGLGAGGFWDAIESVGGRRLTPGQAVDALAEAIGIIRGTWDAADRGRFAVDGDHYRVDGAKRGPAPAHDIPIWIGALKPRMLRLTGRIGDGWLPSLAYLQPGEYARSAARIDEAAVDAGRNPAEIRRLLNVFGRFSAGGGRLLDGPPEQWVEQLLPFVVEDGVDTFILASDDPATMQRFAAEVAPGLREAVARELGDAAVAPARAPRSSLAIAKRRTGIDYDAVPASLAASAVEPGDAGYARVSSTYMRGGAPGLVLQPATTAEVVDAVAFAREHAHLPLSLRSGGHGISGRSTNEGGIVIDLSRLRAMAVLDEASRLVRIEPGARWQDVAAFLEPHGWALSSGDSGGVGVGGLATAGGVGWLVREHGLTIDHLRAVELVLADGRIVRASAEEHPDLFWAVRGAGANIGVVTAFEFEVDKVGDLGFAQLAFDATDTAGFLQAWGDWVVDSPRDVTSFAMFGGGRPGQPVTAHVMAVVDSGEPDTVIARLQPLAEAAPLVAQEVRLTSYRAIVSNAGDGAHSGEGEPLARSGLIGRITPEFARDAARFLESGATHFFQLRAMGGAVHDVPADATAFAHRDAEFSVVAFGTRGRRTSAAWDELIAPHTRGAYLSFETEQGAAQVEAAFPPATLERLRAIKREVDPGDLFRDNGPVGV
ncbi:LLM class flavin-dependent oxidoreductase [Agromyces sp. CFH 90414]|uniref:LLM class flavin-dependent oxidoreductase n=1 Tax=Agromyces agglutinans TaxID=2662258 RepID=A0A6I2FD87_9MICO|nr:LLM class flavin-dependent oxidoreductase [Agromyces agglutinans]MRG59903.1 LLM class flavin-dependent oxidoreductase [Agromyces agglutinans]